jgi:alpha-ketoglutarate-dependent 2,4-dichlorophenoxyacetate dioxygenase
VAITVQPITPEFAAEVGDVALNRPLAADDLAAIRAAFTKYAVLVFPDQEFDDESQLTFARNFGPLETTVFKARTTSCACTNMADAAIRRENRILTANDRQAHNSATGCGTPIVVRRLPAYCSMLRLLDPLIGARPDSPTCARPTTPCEATGGASQAGG